MKIPLHSSIILLLSVHQSIVKDLLWAIAIMIQVWYFSGIRLDMAFPIQSGIVPIQLWKWMKRVQLTVTNVGERDGAEVVQLYVGFRTPLYSRPQKELKGFQKVFLKVGESKRVHIPFDDKTFRYWNVKTGQWEIEEGEYLIMVGACVADIRLSGKLCVAGTTKRNTL